MSRISFATAAGWRPSEVTKAASTGAPPVRASWAKAASRSAMSTRIIWGPAARKPSRASKAWSSGRGSTADDIGGSAGMAAPAAAARKAPAAHRLRLQHPA